MHSKTLSHHVGTIHWPCLNFMPRACLCECSSCTRILLMLGPARKKRACFNGVGELSRPLFGTAMQRDIAELKERYNQLTALASVNNGAMQINCQRLAKLDRHVSDLRLYVSPLKLGLDRVVATLDSLYHFLILNQPISSLENTAISLLHTNQQIVNNVVDAAHGRVTPALFPVKDFMHALDLGKKQYGLAHLFDIRGVHNYYPLLTSFITNLLMTS